MTEPVDLEELAADAIRVGGASAAALVQNPGYEPAECTLRLARSVASLLAELRQRRQEVEEADWLLMNLPEDGETEDAEYQAWFERWKSYVTPRSAYAGCFAYEETGSCNCSAGVPGGVCGKENDGG